MDDVIKPSSGSNVSVVERGIHAVSEVAPPRRSARMHGSIESAVVLCAMFDFVLVFLTGLVACQAMAAGTEIAVSGYAIASAFCAAVFVLVLDYRGLYEPSALLQPARAAAPSVLASALAFGTLGLTSWNAAGHLSYEADWLVAAATLSLAAVVVGRYGFARLVAAAAARGMLSRNLIIIGAGSSAKALLEQIEAHRKPWTNVLGLFDDRARDANGRVARRLHGVRVLGTVDRALTFARRVHVDDIVVALPWTAPDRIRTIVRAAERLSANIHLAPDTLGIAALDQRLMLRDGVPALRVSRKPVAGWNYALKRAMDLAIAVVALILLSPLLLAVAAIIKCESRGPVFFRQPRYGINNRTINVLKFRSMYHEQQDLRADRLVTKDDPRVTPFGRFIRRTSLDELPQLINVLRGDMSIVGPRPHAKNAKAAGRKYQEVVQEYAHRHRIKPGITGWAQVNGWRGETDTEEKILKRCEHDLYYIDNWSFWLDVWIVLATLRAPFHKSAY